MIYRELGKTGMKVSVISMGCEYVWTAPEEQVRELVQEAVSEGINYFDIFVGTPSTREYFGRALEAVRDKVYLAGHLGCADADGQYVKTRDEKVCKDYLNQFYEKLKTDRIDVLFLHNCDDLEDLDGILNGWMYTYAKELKDSGRAGCIGLSSHNTRTALEAVKSGKIDVLMFPVNPLFNLLPQDVGDARIRGRKEAVMTKEEKEAYPTKEQLYEACERMGVPIIAMKPYAAGNALKNHEEGRLKGLLNLTPVQCISYVLSIPQVVCPVPGYANVKELREALAYLTATEEERDFCEINKLTEATVRKQCMYCNHCQPCPKGIDIGEVTKLKDMAERGMTEEVRARYEALSVKAGDCIHCDSCRRRCPFGIDGSGSMYRAAELFGK